MQRIHPISKAYYEAYLALAIEATMPKGMGALRLKAARALKQTTSYEFTQLYNRALIGKRDDHLAVLDNAVQQAMSSHKERPSEQFLRNIMGKFGDRSPTLRAAIVAGRIEDNTGQPSIEDKCKQLLSIGVLGGTGERDIARDKETVAYALDLFARNDSFSFPLELRRMLGTEAKEFFNIEVDRVFSPEALAKHLVAESDVSKRAVTFHKMHEHVASFFLDDPDKLAKLADQLFGVDDVKILTQKIVKGFAERTIATNFLRDLGPHSPLIGAYRDALTDDACATMWREIPQIDRDPCFRKLAGDALEAQYGSRDPFIFLSMHNVVSLLPPHLLAACYWEDWGDRRAGLVTSLLLVQSKPEYKAALLERFEVVTDRMNIPDGADNTLPRRDRIAGLAFDAFRNDPDFLIDQATPVLFPEFTDKFLPTKNAAFYKYAALFVKREPELAQKYLSDDFMLTVITDPTVGQNEHPAHRLFIFDRTRAGSQTGENFRNGKSFNLHRELQTLVDQSLASFKKGASSTSLQLAETPSLDAPDPKLASPSLMSKMFRRLGLGD